MDPIIGGAIIAGGATLASSALNYVSQQQTNSDMIDLANTAHQREKKDLIAAGLNPILSVNKRASTPTLNAPDVDTAAISNSAYQAATLKSNLGLQAAQTQQAAAGAQASSAAAEGTRLNNDYARSANIARLEVLKNEVMLSSLNNDQKRSQIQEIQANIDKIKAETLRLGWSAKNEEKEFQYGRLGSQIMKPVETFLNSGKKWHDRMEGLRLQMPTDSKGWYWTPEGLRQRK